MDATSHAHANRLFLLYRQTGDLEALTLLFEAVSQELLALANHLAPDAALAEDLLQETFLTAIETGAKWDSQRAVLPWLVGILVNKSRAGRRKYRRRIDPDRVRVPVPAGGLEAAQLSELRREVRRAIAGLPPKDAKLLTDLIERGLAPGDLAAEAGIALGTMHVRVHRAIDKLRRALPLGFAGGGLLLGVRGTDAVRQVVYDAAVAAQTPATGWALPSFLKLRGAKLGLVVGSVLVAGTSLALLNNPGESNRSAEPAVPRLQAPQDSSVQALLQGSSTTQRLSIAPGPPKSVEGSLSPPEPGVAAPPDIRMTLDVQGVESDSSEALVLRIKRWRKAGAAMMDVPIMRNGSIEVDVGKLFMGEALQPWDEVGIYLQHPDYLEFGQQAKQVPSTVGAHFAATLKLRAVKTRLRGKLKLPQNHEKAEPMVLFFPGGGPEIQRSHLYEFVSASTDATGGFEIPLSGECYGMLVVVVTGVGTKAFHIRSDEEPVNDLGVIALDNGATISGTALFDGRPLDSGGKVVAIPIASETTRRLTAHGVRLAKGKIVLARVTTTTIDAAGSFTLSGLESGVDYRIALLDPVQNGREYAFDPLEHMGKVFSAPCRGILVSMDLAPVQVLVHGEGVPIAGAQLQFEFSATDEIDLDSKRPGPHSQPIQICSEQGMASIAMPSSGSLMARCSAPGFSARTLEIRLSMIDQEGRIPIQLFPESDSAPESCPVQVSVQLTGIGVHSLEGTEVTLLLLDGDRGIVEVPPQRLTGGELHFSGIPQGKFTLALRTGVDQRIRPDELPFVRTRFSTLYTLDSSLLPPDRVFRIEQEVETGGRVELHVQGFDGIQSPAEFVLVKFSGYTRKPPVLTLDGERGGFEPVTSCIGPGPFWLDWFIESGPWKLRQVGSAYAETEMDLPLELGRNTVVTFQLQAR